MIDTSKNDTITTAAAASISDTPPDFRQTRDFASITDATTLILKKIDFPLKRRNFICALQGVANSREEFQASHHVIARRLGHRGKQESAEQVTYRELKALKKFQFESGIILFDIEPGGEKERRRTTYFDYLVSVALRLRNRATDLKQSNAKYKKAPLGKIIKLIVETAVNELPEFAGSRIAAYFGSTNVGRRPHRPTKPERRATDREKVWRVIAAYLGEFGARDDAANLRQFAGQLTTRINETVEQIIASSSGSKNADLSARVTSPHSVDFSFPLREVKWGEKGEHDYQTVVRPVTRIPPAEQVSSRLSRRRHAPLSRRVNQSVRNLRRRSPPRAAAGRFCRSTRRTSAEFVRVVRATIAARPASTRRHAAASSKRRAKPNKSSPSGPIDPAVTSASQPESSRELFVSVLTCGMAATKLCKNCWQSSAICRRLTRSRPAAAGGIELTPAFVAVTVERAEKLGLEYTGTTLDRLPEVLALLNQVDYHREDA